MCTLGNGNHISRTPIGGGLAGSEEGTLCGGPRLGWGWAGSLNFLLIRIEEGVFRRCAPGMDGGRLLMCLNIFHNTQINNLLICIMQNAFKMAQQLENYTKSSIQGKQLEEQHHTPPRRPQGNKRQWTRWGWHLWGDRCSGFWFVGVVLFSFQFLTHTHNYHLQLLNTGTCSFNSALHAFQNCKPASTGFDLSPSHIMWNFAIYSVAFGEEVSCDDHCGN